MAVRARKVRRLSGDNEIAQGVNFPISSVVLLRPISNPALHRVDLTPDGLGISQDALVASIRGRLDRVGGA